MSFVFFMISGTISFSPSAGAAASAEAITAAMAHENLIFHPVTFSGFDGGFYMNNTLPYTPDDFYFHDVSNDIFVLLWGTVYNRAELVRQYDITRQVSDPELIARLYIIEGADFVKRLNGDFAFIIGQPQKRHYWLFRDHLGIRPVAYFTENNSLCFSSDIIGLCRALSGGEAIDSDFLLGYFKFIDFRKTPFHKVQKLLPGHYLHFSEEATETVKYWEPEKIKIDRHLQYDLMLSELKTLLPDAVKIRCDHRFNAGAHVSSGLDSGIVSTLAREEYRQQRDFYGFSWSPRDYTPADVTFDEREIIIAHCEKTGIKPVFSDLNAGGFNTIISSYYNNLGYFFEDKTAEQARGLNVNLLFSGWGGDEFISAGNRGVDTDLLTGLKWRIFFRRNPVRRPRMLVRNIFYYVILPALGILDRPTDRLIRDDVRYIKKPFNRSDRRAIRDFYFHTSRHLLQLRLLRFYHLPERCESWARNGCLKGLEYRYPLLDRRIVEYMLRVPSELLCVTAGFRPLLREIGKGILPEEVRMHEQKNDPVCWEAVDALTKELSGTLIREVDDWEKIAEMSFVNFVLLKNDIAKYKTDPQKVKSKLLFDTLVYLKGVKEFIAGYNAPLCR